MNNNTLWSLRLGYSNNQAQTISSLGFPEFLERSFQTKFDNKIPAFLENSPKSIKELAQIRKKYKPNSKEAKELLKAQVKTSMEMKAWWIEKMSNSEFPLREKMTCFWHNHFVSTFPKVKVNHWVFQHNQLLRKNAFGNYKELTKQILKNNAMIRYLDNTNNQKRENKRKFKPGIIRTVHIRNRKLYRRRYKKWSKSFSRTWNWSKRSAI